MCKNNQVASFLAGSGAHLEDIVGELRRLRQPGNEWKTKQRELTKVRRE
jgi:hypothetical protein